jgi:hypothetical protein
VTIEDYFPGLRISGYIETSEIEDRYNCIAWAANDSENWWEPDPDYYWPSGVPMEYSVSAHVQAFKLMGYSVCTNSCLEAGVEKVALYVDANGMPTHMARQLPNGHWTSKLGPGPDIQHPTLEGLQGQEYGTVAMILQRPKTSRY